MIMENQSPIKILSQEQLDDIIEKGLNNPLDCFVLLNYGLRSSKEITFNDYGDYCVYNECDDSEEIIPHDSLMSSFLGEAINKGALYSY